MEMYNLHNVLISLSLFSTWRKIGQFSDPEQNNKLMILSRINHGLMKNNATQKTVAAGL